MSKKRVLQQPIKPAPGFDGDTIRHSHISQNEGNEIPHPAAQQKGGIVHPLGRLTANVSHPPVVTARFSFLACIATALVVLSGCHNKNWSAKHVPPPPTITQVPAAPPETTASVTKPASEPTVSPKVKAIYVETGLASWYGPQYHNHKGSNGEIYNQQAMTAAHRTIPLNSVVRVTNETTKHQVVVRITDRGPFVEDRIIDLSLAAAKAVDVWQPGTAMVRVEVLSSPVPLNQGGRWCVQIGAFQSEPEARKLAEKLQDKYQTAKVVQFSGPTGEWVRIRPEGDDKQKALEVAAKTHVKEGGVFLVRLD
ncbi:MAG TPA: septal ring lytic transglycosylase RlpA family protein [Candidatus Binatia bacterium]|nr:septal ring lytic transglycosylase RlpA family protein [Candidatus Binatia bacterium]